MENRKADWEQRRTSGGNVNDCPSDSAALVAVVSVAFERGSEQYQAMKSSIRIRIGWGGIRASETDVYGTLCEVQIGKSQDSFRCSLAFAF